MKELVILIRPEKLEDVKKILDDINCGGMTLSTVMGCGTQKGISSDTEETVNEIRGFKTTINLLPKVKVEVVIMIRMEIPKKMAVGLKTISLMICWSHLSLQDRRLSGLKWLLT